LNQPFSNCGEIAVLKLNERWIATSFEGKPTPLGDRLRTFNYYCLLPSVSCAGAIRINTNQ